MGCSSLLVPLPPPPTLGPPAPPAASHARSSCTAAARLRPVLSPPPPAARSPPAPRFCRCHPRPHIHLRHLGSGGSRAAPSLIGMRPPAQVGARTRIEFVAVDLRLRQLHSSSAVSSLLQVRSPGLETHCSIDAQWRRVHTLPWRGLQFPRLFPLPIGVHGIGILFVTLFLGCGSFAQDQRASLRMPALAQSRICSLDSVHPSAKALQPDLCNLKPWRSNNKGWMRMASYLSNCRTRCSGWEN